MAEGGQHILHATQDTLLKEVCEKQLQWQLEATTILIYSGLCIERFVIVQSLRQLS